MPSLRYFTPQAGRATKGSQAEDEPWGTTSSQSHFKAYEQEDMRSVRSQPAGAPLCLQTVPEDARLSAAHRNPPFKTYNRHREDYPDPSAYEKAESAVTAASGSSSGSKQPKPAPGSYRPEWAKERPFPNNSFNGVSTYTAHQEQAQQARHDYYPYRDEFHPRSKRLLYELALKKHNAASEMDYVSGDDASCFTLPSTAVSRKSGTSRVSRVSRSSSVPSLPPADPERIMTADSVRVGDGGVGNLAKRRAEAFFRAPAMSNTDRDFILDKWDSDGPAGMVCANAPKAAFGLSVKAYANELFKNSDMFPNGDRSVIPREKVPISKKR
eukprot:TRINITY_DN6902_c1_g5_i1.p1 TRINITY_DN6902_c1_g5~~TRINITY_DN6902_c1_g5_i1.p1  ORF type:complete len:326 (+),score=52.56 TRINITY_DN6902_c1_g5_i1:129-1106(+)